MLTLKLTIILTLFTKQPYIIRLLEDKFKIRVLEVIKIHGLIPCRLKFEAKIWMAAWEAVQR
jgi:hypothetical protein